MHNLKIVNSQRIFRNRHGIRGIKYFSEFIYLKISFLTANVKRKLYDCEVNQNGLISLGYPHSISNHT